MNVGLYSFENMTIKQIEKLGKKIQEKFSVDDIYVYSENTKKQRLQQREGLKRLIQDYDNGKINLVVLEKVGSLGSDDYIKSKALELLMKRNVRIFAIKQDIDSTSDIGRQKIQMIILIGEKLKEMNEQKSKASNIDNKEKKNIFFYMRVGNRNQLC